MTADRLAPVPPGIAAHRLLSNGHSAALVRADGEIDWWCAPRFDSAPLVWSLLDADGGFLRWRDARPVDADESPAGPSTRTVVRVPGGRVECRDALVTTSGDGVALVRSMRALDSSVLMTAEFRLGGFDEPWASWTGSSGTVGGIPMAVVSDAAEELDASRGVAMVKVDTGTWSALAFAAGSVTTPDVASLRERVDADAEEFGSSLNAARLPRLYPERAADALAVLKVCTYRESGAVIASPTTSLPEVPGGERQWDYRYCWLRDAGLAVSVAALLGDRKAAEDYLDFVKDLARDWPLPPVASVDGGPVPDERDVPGVRGWAESRPVRVGNAAAEQSQIDVLGLVVEAVSVYVQTGGRLDRETWALVRRIADSVVDLPDEPTNGIWELREPARLLSADIGRWLALDRAVWIARGWRPFARRRRWKRARRKIRNRVLAALGPDGRLPMAYDGETGADASGLMVCMFGMLGRRDKRAHLLVDTVLEDLGSGPFLYRYEPDGRDGFSPGEGTFLPVSWWAVSALAALGRVDEARARAEAMCARLPRLLPEQIDAGSGHGLGNVPLVWSHAEVARSLYVLDAAMRRERGGPVWLWIWRLARYVSLRWRARDR